MSKRLPFPGGKGVEKQDVFEHVFHGQNMDNCVLHFENMLENVLAVENMFQNIMFSNLF